RGRWGCVRRWGIPGQRDRLPFRVKTYAQRVVPIRENAGVERQTAGRQDGQVERRAPARANDLQGRNAQILAAPEDVRLTVRVGDEFDGDGAAVRPLVGGGGFEVVGQRH